MQCQNINALNATISSNFLSNLISAQNSLENQGKESRIYEIHNHTGYKIELRPQVENPKSVM